MAKKKTKLSEIKFKNIGHEERKILLTALNYKLDELKCQYCKEKVNYKDCGIMPSTDLKRKVTITCSSPICASEYITDLEE